MGSGDLWILGKGMGTTGAFEVIIIRDTATISRHQRVGEMKEQNA